MTTLRDFKNHLVFDCSYKPRRINPLSEMIKDFDIYVDLQICSHCFYDSEKTPKLDKINISHNKPKKKSRSQKNKDKKRKIKNKSEKNK